jgi:hypothetical protein
MYLWWFDENPKKATELKIAEAVDAYVFRTHTKPNVVLVNDQDYAEVAGVEVRRTGYVRRFNFWVGWEDPQKLAA